MPTTNATFFTAASDTIADSLAELWSQFFVSFLPSFIVALIVLFVGWAISVAIGRLVEKALVVLRVNAAFESIQGLKKTVEQASLKLDVPRFIGEMFKWFFILVFLLAATDILGLQAVSSFLKDDVITFLPNVIVAVLILTIAVVLANFIYRTVLASVEAAGFTGGALIATISKWAIIIFAFLAALQQMEIFAPFIQTFFTAFFAMIAIAGGLAFGLGGKDLAAKWLKKAEEDITGRRKP